MSDNENPYGLEFCNDLLFRAGQRRERKTSINKMISQAEKVGKIVTSVTTAEGVTLRFDEAKQDGSNNSWDEVLRRAAH